MRFLEMRGGHLHVAGVEAQFQVALVAERAGGHGDTDEVRRIGTVAQQAVVEGELAYAVHRLVRRFAGDEGDRFGWLIEHMRAFELRLVARLVGAGCRAQLGAQFSTFRRVAGHDRHHLVPGASDRLAEGGVVGQGLAVDDQQILDMARHAGRVEDLVCVGRGRHFL
jgi:hypothetical protein